MKDLVEIFWKQQSLFGKLYVLVVLSFIGFFVYIGFLFLAGDLEVEKSPEVVPSETQYDCTFSELTGDYYCPDPPERWEDEFPARP